MAIPNYQEVMLPLLRLLEQASEPVYYRDAANELAQQFALTDEEINAVYPKSGAVIYLDRVVWATTHLKIAELIVRPTKGYLAITQVGRDLLTQQPSFVGVKLLLQYPAYAAHMDDLAKRQPKSSHSEISAEDQTPAELIDSAVLQVESEVKEQLKELLAKVDPFYFERIIIILLLKMGYGGSEEEMAKALSRGKDGGVDGWVKEDKLGLDVMYIQAKRHQAPIGKPDVQAFVGALEERNSNKGIFATTSYFTSGVREYLAKINKQIVLIEGEELAELLLEYNVGVRVERSLELKKIDSSFFAKDTEV